MHLKTLRFESVDISLDIGVIPDEGTQDNPKRKNAAWVIIKPRDALHKSYYDANISDKLKNIVRKSVDWFLGFDFES